MEAIYITAFDAGPLYNDIIKLEKLLDDAGLIERTANSWQQQFSLA